MAKLTPAQQQALFRGIGGMMGGSGWGRMQSSYDQGYQQTMAARRKQQNDDMELAMSIAKFRDDIARFQEEMAFEREKFEQSKYEFDQGHINKKELLNVENKHKMAEIGLQEGIRASSRTAVAGINAHARMYGADRTVDVASIAAQSRENVAHISGGYRLEQEGMRQSGQTARTGMTVGGAMDRATLPYEQMTQYQSGQVGMRQDQFDQSHGLARDRYALDAYTRTQPMGVGGGGGGAAQPKPMSEAERARIATNIMNTTKDPRGRPTMTYEEALATVRGQERSQHGPPTDPRLDPYRQGGYSGQGGQQQQFRQPPYQAPPTTGPPIYNPGGQMPPPSQTLIPGEGGIPTVPPGTYSPPLTQQPPSLFDSTHRGPMDMYNKRR